jgi:hypothetical protein
VLQQGNKLDRFSCDRLECTITFSNPVWEVRNFDLVLVALPARVRQAAEVVPLRVLLEVHEVETDFEAAHHQMCMEASSRNGNLSKGKLEEKKSTVCVTSDTMLRPRI